MRRSSEAFVINCNANSLIARCAVPQHGCLQPE